MQIKPAELEALGYVLTDKLSHTDLVPFIRLYMGKPTRFARLYFAANMAAAGYAGFLFYHFYGTPGFTLLSGLDYFCIGLALAFALVPLHEFIHVLAYKLQGAEKTSYAANFKKFYFAALADGFVADRREFIVVAAAPFVFITTSLIAASFFVNTNWQFALAGILFTHTACCSGDFGLLSYFDFNNDVAVVTFDDVPNKITYFYTKP